MSALRERFPNERYIYYSDNRFVPYGIRNSNFLKDRFYTISDELKKAGAQITVVGCNTMGVTLGLDPDFKPPSAVSWIYPEAYPEREDTLIMTTPLSAQSHYIKTLSAEGAELLCDGALAGMSEASGGISPEIEERLCGMPRLNRKRTAVTLGCTHYIYFAETVARLTGAVRIYDGLQGAVERAARLITGEEEQGLEFVFSGSDESERYSRIFSEVVGKRMRTAEKRRGNR